MTRPVAVFVCPGRGSYGQGELGCLRRTLRDGPVAQALAAADAERTAAGEPTISELDAAERFRPALHLNGRNAAELIYLATLAHAEVAAERYAVAAVAGNSLGWYTALAVAGALSVLDGWRLVRTMARLQELAAGGQVLTTVVDDAWHVDPAQVDAVDTALAATNARGADWFVAPSIRLGGHIVLAGTEAGVKQLLAALPPRKVGSREFPFRLAGHGPFHTRLCTDVAAAATRELAALLLRMPTVPLIDGRGDVWSAWSTDPQALRLYTTTTQVLETYDFTASVRTGLREFCPDTVVCLGPGESLRAPVGHVALAERYRGVGSKDALFATQLVATA